MEHYHEPDLAQRRLFRRGGGETVHRDRFPRTSFVLISYFEMPAKPPRTYFAAQLADEQPLSQRTASRLCRLAADIAAAKPWTYMDEDQMIAVLRKKGAQPDFISVLGALGQHRAIHVYPGLAGYAWFRDVAEASDKWRLRLMLTECEALQAAYPAPDEITDLDMELIRGCRFRHSGGAFHFRSVRRGFFPWYICEEEGQRLALCLEAFLQMLISGILKEPEKWWPEEPGTMPIFARQGGQWVYSRIVIRTEKVLQPRLWVSEERLAGLPFRGRGGVLCLGDHFMRGAAGLKNERPIVLHLLAVVDARSGFAFEPRLREPGEILASAAAEVLVQAIEARGAIPNRVLVSEPYYAEELKALARAAGFEIELRRRLPALEDLFRSLEKFERRWAAQGPEPA